MRRWGRCRSGRIPGSSASPRSCRRRTDDPLDRAAEAGAELFHLELGLFGRVEEVAGVEGVIPEVEIAAAAERVAARLGDRRDDGAGGPAVFRRVVRREHAKFLDALAARRLQARAALAAVRHERVVHVRGIGAVQQKVVLRDVGAVERERGDATAADLRGGREQRQAREVTAVDRQTRGRAALRWSPRFPASEC